MARKTEVKGKTRGSSRQKKTASSASSAKVRDMNREKDLREDHRVPIQLLVDYQAHGNYLFDFCRDLGAGGIFIETRTPLPKGSEIDLTFTLPDCKETLQTKGEVIWVQPEISGRKDLTPGMGVQFSSFGGEQRRTLQDFVSRYHGDRFKAQIPKKPA